MHINIESLMGNAGYMDTVRDMLRQSGRSV